MYDIQGKEVYYQSSMNSTGGILEINTILPPNNYYLKMYYIENDEMNVYNSSVSIVE